MSLEYLAACPHSGGGTLADRTTEINRHMYV